MNFFLPLDELEILKYKMIYYVIRPEYRELKLFVLNIQAGTIGCENFTVVSQGSVTAHPDCILPVS